MYFPVAANCCDEPCSIDVSAGVTAIDDSAGAIAGRVVDPLIVQEAAMIVVVPRATLVANLLLLMVATVVTVELDVTELVMFWVVSSL